MKKELLFAAAAWMAGVIIYVALSGVIARAISLAMMRWAYGDRPDWFVKYETASLSRSVFLICIFWGALYASALAKPVAFGRTSGILKHLAGSYAFGLVGWFLAALLRFPRFPDFESNLALSVYPFVVLVLSALCFVLGIATWIRLAFFGKAALQNEIARTAELKS